MKILVMGAGAWGTALALRAAQRHEVLLWARDARHVQALREQGLNQRYLPGVPLPAALQLSADFAQAQRHLDGGGLAVVATPMSGLRSSLQALAGQLPALWLCKGFEADTGALGHEIAAAVRPQAPAGVLSGPSFAVEVARGQPTALVAASVDETLTALAVDAFHGESLRIYRSADPVGVEVGGAVKNVLAIAAGILDGLAQGAETQSALKIAAPVLDPTASPNPVSLLVPGLNARAALITRGLAEMTRLGLAMGAQAGTFMGLSGLGDLVLTATGALSRNRQVGLELAAGKALPDVLSQLGHVAEGVYSARTVWMRAQRLGVEMPITAAVLAVLDGVLTPRQAAAQLMARDARAE